MSKKKLKSHKKFKNKAIRRKKGKNNWFCGFLVFLMLIAVAGASIYYLGLINNSATSGYVISDLEKKLEDLKDVNQKLEVEVIELGQIDRVEKEAVENLSMVKTEAVGYLSDRDKVAVR